VILKSSELLEVNKGAITQCDYFKYLEQLQDRKGHFSLRFKYLMSRGFIVGKDKASPELLSLLMSIHSYYYWLQHKKRRLK
jgi:hypothetical protein